jgi:hypothetical protein
MSKSTNQQSQVDGERSQLENSADNRKSYNIWISKKKKPIGNYCQHARLMKTQPTTKRDS